MTSTPLRVGFVAVSLLVPACAGCTEVLSGILEFLPVSLAVDISSVDVEFDHPFVERRDHTLRMDIFRPLQATEPAPVVVLIHGGAWVRGERWHMHDWALDLAGQGYLAVSVDYRVLNEGGMYPAPVADVLAAIAYIRSHSGEWNADPTRVTVFGVSAGAHLALLAGLAKDPSIFDPTWPPGESAGIRAVVEINGPTDFTVPVATGAKWQDELLSAFLGCSQSECPERWREASPVSYVRTDGPAVLILHGALDPIVPVSQAHSLRDALEAVGQPFSFIEIPRALHFWGSQWTSEWAQRHRSNILQFLQDHG
jgi:acetyl esterase/lipase